MNDPTFEPSSSETELSSDKSVRAIREVEATEIPDETEAEDDHKDTKVSGPEISGILAAKEILNALSKSGLPEGTKHEFSEMARKVWKGWQVNLDGIEFDRKPKGDQKRIGKGAAGDIYLGRMKMRGENGYV